jgi:hypothetical protein
VAGPANLRRELLRQYPCEYFPQLAYSISPLENIFHTQFPVWLPEVERAQNPLREIGHTLLN